MITRLRVLAKVWWITFFTTWAILYFFGNAEAVKMNDPYSLLHTQLDRVILGFENHYNECREENIKLIRPEQTELPFLDLDMDLGEIKEKHKFRLTYFLYNMYFICLQENRRLLEHKGL